MTYTLEKSTEGSSVVTIARVVSMSPPPKRNYLGTLLAATDTGLGRTESRMQ